MKKISINLYTDDRYETDVHYEGGCVLGHGMLSWASYMFPMNALPADPRYVDPHVWLTQWKERLDKVTNDIYQVSLRVCNYNFTIKLNLNPYPDYCRFNSVLLVEQIIVIGNEMCV